MPDPGGSATIHGILYQILANLWRVSEIQLETKLAGQEIQSARLILEPRGGGGDTRYEGEGVRIIEQYKTRGGTRTWSLNNLIEGVLPDLFIAVDPHRLTETSIYRFVTDGRCGRIDHFRRFLNDFRFNPAPASPLESLDHIKKYPFFGRDNLTDRDLFLHIAHRVRSKADRAEDALHHRKLWHLLAGLDIHDRQSASDLKHAIDEFLIQVVDHREDVDAKRRELCTILMERASRGNAACTPEEFLRSAQLNATPLCKLGTLKAKLRELAEEHFNVKQYDKDRNVRDVPIWPSDCSILVFAGESGQGKTWQLCHLADSILATGGSAVVISTTGKGDAEADLQQASDEVWLTGLNHDAPIKIDRLTARYQEKHHRLAGEWLTICLDDVQESGEINRLLTYPWKPWGIKLAITAPLAVGKALLNRKRADVHVVEVPDFTSRQTQNYLERRGRDWGEIRDDVRAILRRPILAELYCQIAGAGGWRPHNEYEIYARYWDRVVAPQLTVISAPALNKAFTHMRGTPTRLGWEPTRRRHVI